VGSFVSKIQTKIGDIIMAKTIVQTEIVKLENWTVGEIDFWKISVPKTGEQKIIRGNSEFLKLILGE
tara:strand:+ start:628 stop:828 length:201 start_codon:yes stop_codon:yes gene_type:complete